MSIIRRIKDFRRKVYALRAYVPGLKRHHVLDNLVGPVGFWKPLQAYQIKAVRALGLRPEHKMLDFGCGPLQGGRRFIEYLNAGNYVGLDEKPAAIKAAQEEIVRHGLVAKQPRLILANDFGERDLGNERFDFIWVSQLFYCFNDEVMGRLLGCFARRLTPTGVLAGDILGPRTDRSFDPSLPLQTPESLAPIARAHGLVITNRGELVDLGYPPRTGLRFNLMLEFRRVGSAG